MRMYHINFLPFGNGVDGVRAEYNFDNGFGASIVKTEYSYGGKEGLYEIAVLDSTGNLTYETSVTSDVIGHLSLKEVMIKLEEIERLQKTVDEV